MSRRLLHIVYILSAMSLLASCSSSRRATAVASTRPSATELRVPSADALHPSARALVKEAQSWLGTPYKYGGNDRSGVDCSGLVLQVYLRALDISLPRNSRAQKDYCTSASLGSLTPGDLVFFATGKQKGRVSHVGIFVGDNKMIHASTSKGVIVTDLSQDYYTRTFAGAGYVGQYHAMLGKTKPKTPRKKKKKEPDPRPVREPEPDGEIHIAPIESPAGITLTPVASLPERKTPQPDSAQPTATPVRQQAAATVHIVTPVTPATSTTPASEPTVEDARAAVLGSIIEKDLK